MPESSAASRNAPSKSGYKYLVYRSDDIPRRFYPGMLEEMIKKMNEDELWEELKKLYESED
jgi:hypothetical protein